MPTDAEIRAEAERVRQQTEQRLRDSQQRAAAELARRKGK